MSSRRDKILWCIFRGFVVAALWILWAVTYEFWLKEHILGTEIPDCLITDCLPASTPNLCSVYSKHYGVAFEDMIHENCTLAETESNNNISGHVALCCQPQTYENLLVSTTMAEYHEFPHQASIKSDIGLCAATIYNRRFLITAAHCLVNENSGQVTDVSTVRVKVGSNFKEYELVPEYVYTVESVTPHPEYGKLATSREWQNFDSDNRRFINDLALVKVDRNISFDDTVKALQIASRDFDPSKYGSSVVVVGWGKTDTLEGTQWLQKSRFLLHLDEHCFEPDDSDLKDQLLCAGGFANEEWSPVTGNGDSGGPGICRNENERPVLCGVVSLGCTDENCVEKWDEESCSPTVFAKVALYNDWITEVAGAQEEHTLYKAYLYGQTVDKRDYLHQVRIVSRNNDEEVWCGGTLIQPDVVLTDAYCLFYEPMNIEHVRVTVSNGQNFSVKIAKSFQNEIDVQNTRSKRALVNVVNKVLDLGMTNYVVTNDLAVLLLNDSVQIPNEKLSRLPKPGEAFSKGHELSYDSYDNLISRDFVMLKQDYCDLRMAALNITLEDNILCGVEKYSGGSTCDRDYGGGLLCQAKEDGQPVLCGISVWRQCKFSIPNAFLNVGLLQKWVEATILELRLLI